jgi:hypothetical protein
MSGVDERLRARMHAVRSPVSDDGVFELVDERHRRMRAIRRVRVAALVVVVLTATAFGTATLMRAFDAGDPRPFGDGTAPPVPTPAPQATCLASSLSVDLDGDAVADSLRVYSPAPTCESPAVGSEYVADVELASGPAYRQPLPVCDELAPCRLFAAPDLDGDGVPEIAIAYTGGVSSVGAALYRFVPDPSDGEALVRLEVAEPGDPWHENFGILPGPSTVVWYGSVTHLHWVSCEEDPKGRPAVLTALRDRDDPSTYHVHGTLFDVSGTTLRVAFTWDEAISEAVLRLPETDFCGAPILPPV